jgi:DNA-binding transcriptional MerR regulator
MEDRYSTKQFAQMVGRETRTLYTWARAGKLIPKKDFNGRNVYTATDYAIVMGDLKDEKD